MGGLHFTLPAGNIYAGSALLYNGIHFIAERAMYISSGSYWMPAQVVGIPGARMAVHLSIQQVGAKDCIHMPAFLIP